MHLQAEGRSAGTLESYLIGVRLFLRHCEAAGIPAVLDRRTVNGFTAGLLAAGAAPATARARHMALRRFSAWLADEGETPPDELLGLKPPRLDVRRALERRRTAGREARRRAEIALYAGEMLGRLHVLRGSSGTPLHFAAVCGGRRK